LYEFDDDKILPAAESDLEVVFGLLEDYPDMIIELSSHTDYRGNAAYNANLSQRRAESARNWLLEKGVNPDRIVAKGYGKEQPQTVSAKVAEEYEFLPAGVVLTRPFIDDSLSTEEEKEVAHQINRRTEFKILEGPTSITIKRTELRKKEDPNAEKKPAKKKPAPKPPVISELSSLFGRKDLSQVPILDFVTRTTSFGTVKKGDKKEFDFIFANKGKVEARIDTYSACDCTTVTFPRKVIPPGEVGVVHVVFDSSEKEEGEKIVIDIFLENEDEEGNPIIEKVEYTFDISK
jgi:peptidoglycan-associated lipoprotein